MVQKQGYFCFTCVHNQSLVGKLAHTLLTRFPKAVNLRGTHIYIYTHPFSKTLQFEKKKKKKKGIHTPVVKKRLFLMRKQKVYIFHVRSPVRVYFRIATFLKTGIYISIIAL